MGINYQYAFEHITGIELIESNKRFIDFVIINEPKFNLISKSLKKFLRSKGCRGRIKKKWIFFTIKTNYMFEHRKVYRIVHNEKMMYDYYKEFANNIDLYHRQRKIKKIK